MKTSNMSRHSSSPPKIRKKLGTAALIGLGCSAEIFRQVLDACLGAVARSSRRIDGNELSISNTAADVVSVLDLVKGTASAGQNWSCTKLGL
jgi:hypothetical protein